MPSPRYLFIYSAVGGEKRKTRRADALRGEGRGPGPQARLEAELVDGAQLGRERVAAEELAERALRAVRVRLARSDDVVVAHEGRGQVLKT